MKRYSPSVKFSNSQGEHAIMTEDPKGEYVRIRDIPNVFLARMADRDNLITMFVGHTFDSLGDVYNDPNLMSLIDRIAGKEVYLLARGRETFEFEDDNYWLPRNSFTMIRQTL